MSDPAAILWAMPRQSVPTQPAEIAARIEQVPVADELRDSFMPYALSVITARAIPDVRDGLKPVQRRILYAMNSLGLRPGEPYRKSAAVVGEVMGKFHPHGDAAIYEAMVRMGQPFASSVTLVDPKGNFGSLDDPPAAYRYTEARLTAAAAAMTADIDEETVDFRDTFDGERTEPTCLPAAWPNLLVNGAAGIAVGMATQMPPHNLGEVVAAVLAVLKTYQTRTDPTRPGARGRKGPQSPSLDDLLCVLGGPDFPGGGLIVDDGTLGETYRKGQGSIRLRAKAHVEQVTRRRQQIVITELPYLVGPERLMGEIRKLQQADRLAEVASVTDLSDRHSGLRLVIETKTDQSAAAVLSTLYRRTSLETNFPVKNVVLVGGVPDTPNVLDLCRHFIAHRLEVVTRRTEYRLRRAEERLHILDGLLVALDNLDLVISIIRAAADVGVARDELMSQLDLTEVQATHILDLQLRRLTALESTKLRDEHAQLTKDVAGYKRLLKSEPARKKVVGAELAELASQFGTPRRSTIVPLADIEAEAAAAQQSSADGSVMLDGLDGSDEADAVVAAREVSPQRVTLSTTGLIGRRSTASPLSAEPGRHDVLAAEVEARPSGTLVAITSAGRAIPVSVEQLAQVAGRSRGVAATKAFELARNEKVVGLLSDDPPPGGHVLLATASGGAKRLERGVLDAAAAKGADVLSVVAGDRVVAGFDVPQHAEVGFVTDDGHVLRTAADDFAARSPSAGTINAVSLRSNKVLAAGVVGFDTVAALVTRDGAVKLTEMSQIPSRKRDTFGEMALRVDAGGKGFSGAGPPLRAAYLGRPVNLAAIVDDEGLDAGAPKPQPVPLDVAATGRTDSPEVLMLPTQGDGETGAPSAVRVQLVGVSRFT